MRRQTPAQIGICSWSLHPKDPHELAEKVREVGVTQVQMHLSPPHDAVWGRAKEVLEAAGCRIVSGMFGCVGEDYSTLESIRRTGGVVPDQHWERNLKIAKEAAAVAGDWGIKLVSTHAGFLPEAPADPNYAKLQDRLARIAEAMAERGLTLLFETGQETAPTLVRFLRNLLPKAKNIGVNFDPANMILYGKGEPVASLRQLLPFVKQVHIKDAAATTEPGTWGKEVAVGEGQVDWRQFVRTLAEGDFAGPMIIEREAGENRVADAKRAAQLLRGLMA